MESGPPQADFVKEVGGVRLEKSLQEDKYHLPSIEFEFESGRSEPVTVTLRDPIPDSVALEEIGFHREYGKEHWDIEEQQLIFEYELGAGEEYRTVYGFKPDAVDLSQNLVTTPDEFTVTPEEPTVPEGKPMARSTSDSPYPGESAAHTGTTDGGEDTETAGGVDLDEEAANVDRSDADIGSVADRLAEELERDEVSEESLEILERRLSTSLSRTGSEDARLEQLQKDVTNLRAYTNALEEFLDEEGSAKEIIEEFDRRVDRVEEQLDSLQTKTSNLEDTVDTVESGLREVDDTVESLTTEFEELETELDTLDQDLASIDERVPAYSIDERFADLQEELESIDEFVSNLKTAFE